MVRKYKKKTPLAKVTDALDVAWSLIIKMRAGFRCECCGETRGLNSHHVVGRANHQTRWLLANGCCLCSNCHKFSRTLSAHGTPTIFSEWIIKNKGENWHEELTEIANSYKKWTLEDRKELLAEFRLMIKEERCYEY